MRSLLAAAHSVWLRLPRERRQAVFYRATSLAAPKPDRDAAGGLPIGVAGLLGTATGLGEGARLTLDALERTGFAPRAFDLSPWFGQSDLPGAPRAARPLSPGEGGTLLVHVNAPYLPYAMRRLGARRIAGRRIIGYWAWELPRVPASWRFGLRFVHEVWVPSRFTADAIRQATRLPVQVVPHPLPSWNGPTLSRVDFGIAPETVVVLCMFHIGSSFERKNPLAAVAAFRQAFGDASDRLLLVKLIDPGTAPWARRALDAAIAGAPNIRVVDETLTRDQVGGLLGMADIVLSLHRAEGFGLVLAEAMQLGRAVVATGWSGNLDFMTERNAALVSCRFVPAGDPQGTYDAADQEWAEPAVGHAADWLRRLAGDAELRRRLGSQAAADVARQLGPEAFARKVAGLIGSPPQGI